MESGPGGVRDITRAGKEGEFVMVLVHLLRVDRPSTLDIDIDININNDDYLDLHWNTIMSLMMIVMTVDGKRREEEWSWDYGGDRGLIVGRLITWTPFDFTLDFMTPTTT